MIKLAKGYYIFSHKRFAKKHNIRRNCHSCYYRHGCRHDFNKMFPKDKPWDNCKYWKLGQCYTCKYVDEPDELEWYKRGCETWCFGGCNKYEKRNNISNQLLKLIKNCNKGFNF